jgi:hypothetical protein
LPCLATVQDVHVRLARVIRARLGLGRDGVQAESDFSSAFALNVGESGAATAASTAHDEREAPAKPDPAEGRSRTGRTTEEER